MTTEKESPLSRKEYNHGSMEHDEFWFRKEDVKEAVEKLKEGLLFKHPTEELTISTLSFNQFIIKEIDKIFGFGDGK